MRIAIIASALAVLGGLVEQAKRLESIGEDVPVATQSLVVKNPADLQWMLKEALPRTPSPAHSALAWGDPATIAYAFFGEFPAGFTVPMHWHKNDVLGGDDEEQHGHHPGGRRTARDQGRGLLLAAGQDEVRGPTRPGMFVSCLG